MDSPDTCHECGAPITTGRCRRCESWWQYRIVHREIVVLVVLVAATVVMSVATRRLAVSNERLRLQDARVWFAEGERALDAGDVDLALVDLRRAAAKDPDAHNYQLALARALMTAHQDETARPMLLYLRDRQPEDADTNLQLARLEARRGDPTTVGRYYQAAIMALWPAGQQEQQRRVRTEFIEFLLAHGYRDRALSELLMLESSLPDAAASQREAGRMLLAAGDARRASDHFERALRQDANDQVALAGAGESAFEVGDYLRARRYLNALKENTDRTRALRTVTNLMVSHDPLAPRLSIGERKHRLTEVLGQVTRHLEACRASAPAGRRDAGVDLEPLLVELRALDITIHARNWPKTAEGIDAGFDAAVRGERLADRACGSPDPFDRAILLVARRHGLEDR